MKKSVSLDFLFRDFTFSDVPIGEHFIFLHDGSEYIKIVPYQTNVGIEINAQNIYNGCFHSFAEWAKVRHGRSGFTYN